MPHEADIPEIRQIFLSATAQDCKAYREAVRDFIHDNIEAAKVFLQENWAEGGNFVEPVCKRKVDECDAYMGLFGYRYGWTPPLQRRSITELEFRWAVDRWDAGEAPIFVLRPVPGSEADRHLRDQAAVFHGKLSPADADQAGQRTFLASVDQWASEGRIQVFYNDPNQLLGKALFVEGAAAISVASTVPSRRIRPCSARLALIATKILRVSPRVSSSRLNFSRVVASGADSRHRFIRTPPRIA